MKTRTVKQKLILWSCALTVVTVTVFFSMRFYKNGAKYEPENPVENINVTLNPQDNGGTIEVDGKDESSAEENESQSDNVDNLSEDSRAHSDEQFENKKNPLSNQTGNGDNSQDNSAWGLIGAKDKPEKLADAPQKEYFTTSINDGETVNRKDFSFTITHLDKTLSVKKIEVQVNGETVNQFSGHCTLTEGENRIRVSCTYTDSLNAVKRAFKEYIIRCDLGNIVFFTDLEDKTVQNAEFEFTAGAKLGEKKIPLKISVNGRELTGENNYSAQLNEGCNTIVLSAKTENKSKTESFTINYVPMSFGIETDLYDRTVNSADFSFNAKLVGASLNGRFAAAVNGKSIQGTNGVYRCVLNSGRNTIRLRASDGEKSDEKTFSVTYIPLSDENTAPKISYINITDGMTVRGSSLTLEMTARDYSGERIYADKINLSLNGVITAYSAQSNSDNGVTSYFLKLAGGVNTLDVRIFDSEGRFCDYLYVINCHQVGAGEQIGNISVSFDAKTLGFEQFCVNESFAVYEGETGFDALKRFLEENGFGMETDGDGENGYYIKRVYKDGAFAGGQIQSELADYLIGDGVELTGSSSNDSLGEFDYSRGSGWVYSVGGQMPAYGISNISFRDGDSVRLTFSLAYGKDIEGAENAYDKVW